MSLCGVLKVMWDALFASSCRERKGPFWATTFGGFRTEGMWRGILSLSPACGISAPISHCKGLEREVLGEPGGDYWFRSICLGTPDSRVKLEQGPCVR